MKNYKKKICIRCQRIYKPTSARQKYCHDCIPNARKEFYCFNVKRWRSRMTLKELKEYRRKENLRRKPTRQAYSKYQRNIKRYGGNYYIALERDNFTCQECGGKDKLCVHHIDGKGRNTKKPNNKLFNLITLCKSCHPRKHPEGWFKKGHPPFRHS